jgi:Ca2+-binding RTX toxin-like protein
MAQPTAQDQEMLELVNRLRQNPSAELDLLLNSSDPKINQALDFFKVNRDALRQDWQQLKPVAPVAWSSELDQAASTHNQLMIANDQQSHSLPGEAGLIDRDVNAGYKGGSNFAENIFAFSDSVEYGHAGFAIDWGNGPNGIQSPAGHRDTLLSPLYREVGIAIDAESNPNTKVGPNVVTQEFGNRFDLKGKAWLLGVVYDDTSSNKFYNAGEGVKDVTVRVTKNGSNQPIDVQTADAGGYQLQLDPGNYQLQFLRGGQVLDTQSFSIDATNPINVKRDLLVGATAPVTPPPVVPPTPPVEPTPPPVVPPTPPVDTNPPPVVPPTPPVDTNPPPVVPPTPPVEPTPPPVVPPVDTNPPPVVPPTPPTPPVEPTPPVTKGTEGNDRLVGTDGNDVLRGLRGDDFIAGGLGDDQLYGNKGNDAIFGNQGNDLLAGGQGDDQLSGGDGNDTLLGGRGNDRLVGNAGDDLLVGSCGKDLFVLESSRAFQAADFGLDTFQGFKSGQDKIQLAGESFGALKSVFGEGFSQASEFAVVATDDAAAGNAAAIIYSSGSGKVIYNANGSADGLGDGAAIAQLTNKPNLIASDFIIAPRTSV